MSPIDAARAVLRLANVSSEERIRETQAGGVFGMFYALTGGFIVGVKLKPTQIGVSLAKSMIPLYWIFEYKELSDG